MRLWAYKRGVLRYYRNVFLFFIFCILRIETRGGVFFHSAWQQVKMFSNTDTQQVWRLQYTAEKGSFGFLTLFLYRTTCDIESFKNRDDVVFLHLFEMLDNISSPLTYGLNHIINIRLKQYKQ